jgi:hypothetical protein
MFAIYSGDLNGAAICCMFNRIISTNSSVVEALKILERRDYIEKKENTEYQLIDPLIATALKRVLPMSACDETNFS